MAESSAFRPAPTANGTFAKTPLLHLILYALDKKLSGSVELLSPDKRGAVILFVQGQPAKVRTSEPVAYLGTVLKEMGLLTEDQLSQSLAKLAKEKAAGKRLHGQVLIADGWIDGEKLRSGLVEQIGRKLRHIAAMAPATAYAYYDGLDILRTWGTDDPRGTDPLPFLRGILRENPPQEHLKAALKRIAARALRLARDASIPRLHLSKEEAFAVELLRLRPLRPAELGTAGRLDEPSAEQLAYLLMAAKQVEVVTVSETTVTTARGRMAHPGTTPRSFTPTPGKIFVPPNAKLSPLPGATPSAPTTPAPQPSAAPEARSPLTPAAPPPGLSAELAGRWKEIVERAATIERADYFMMLDVARDATREQVEASYVALAKRWHPDRLPPELAPVRDACSRVFGRMSEARSTLTDPEKHSRYMKLIAEGSGSPEMQEAVAKVLDAAREFQKAEICFKRNDLPQAEALCRKAFEGDPSQPDYLAMLAWLVAQKPENQSADKTLESIKMLDRAVALSELCEKAYFYRGMLYKRLHRGDMAAKDFKRVVEMNPRNIDAAREVRLQHMRGRSSSPAPGPKTSMRPGRSDEAKGGLLGRLFKK